MKYATFNASTASLHSSIQILILGIAFSIGCLISARLQADILDPSFGIAGVAELGENVMDRPHSMTIASDGSIYVLGETYENLPQGWNLLVARYNSNGTLHATFGGDGVIQVDYEERTNEPRGIAVQDDGKLLVLFDDATDGAILKRYHSYGIVDDTFAGGVIVLDELIATIPEEIAVGFGLSTPVGLQVVDGKIIVVGETNIARLNLNGTLDASFANGGTLSTKALIPGSPKLIIKDLVAADGRLHLLTTEYTNGKYYTYVIGLDDFGMVDPTFGSGGIASPPEEALEEADVLLVHDGIITIGGGERIIRMDYFGMLDSNFSIDGIVYVGTGCNITDVVLQPGGLIAASVLLPDPEGGNANEVAVVRFGPDGQPDIRLKQKTFGVAEDGWFRSTWGEKATTMSLFGYSNGKLLLFGGYRKNTGNENLLLMRLAPSSKPNGRLPDRVPVGKKAALPRSR